MVLGLNRLIPRDRKPRKKGYEAHGGSLFEMLV